MGKNKLKKFADLLTFQNVYENFNPAHPQLERGQGEVIDMKGAWREKCFQNDNPLVLELACGRGEYSVGLASMYPDKNFIGVDIKGARIWKGAREAMDKNLTNVAFLRTRIEQICYFFAKDEVNEIWITFPDPFLKNSKTNRRLTSQRFLKEYREILIKEGIIHLKTDSPELYDFTMAEIAADEACNIIYQNENIYSSPLKYEELAIKTYYERSHLEDGRLIKYIRYTIS